jgi:glycine C-acetyltransferase/8-amino-7-oxononanoate synthase
MSELQQRLDEIEARGLRRRMRLVQGPQGAQVLLEGRPVTLLCSNNYLGLASETRLRRAAAEAALREGVGAGASRLISGTMTAHGELERALAEFHRTESSLLFGSGYLANIGVIGALAGRGDVVFSDELNHASIVDGCRLSRARVIVYGHRDVEHLAASLQQHRGGGRALIATDSVFSMDGDVAPLAEIVELARRHDAQVLVDEAHAIGAVGPGGRGAVAAAGLSSEVDALVGTLGKALGSYGAYVCADALTIRYLVNVARSFIFSTAPPPPAVAAAGEALRLLAGSTELPDALHRAARTLRSALRQHGFAVAENEMHIVPLLVGDSERAVAFCEAALERGVFAQAIRPPTVPEGTSRLRLAAIATHGERELAAAATSLRDAAEAVGLQPRDIGEALPALAG